MRTPLQRVGVVVLSLCAAAPIVRAAQNATEPQLLLVGTVRTDGVLVPMAARDGEIWTPLRVFDPDGRGLYRLADPARIPREGWAQVAPGAGRATPLALRELTATDASCSQQEGFTTDAAASQELRLALHGNVSLAVAENVAGRPDEEARRVADLVERLTHTVEEERAAIPSRAGRAQLPATGRERVPVRITTLLRNRAGGVGSYYVEAQKTYERVETYLTGWIVASEFSLRLVRVDAGVDRGGETARRRGRLLSLLRLGPGTAWVMHMRAYEGDSVDFVEMPSGRVSSVYGSGC